MSIRRTLARLHRWIGLASGLIVFVVAITGAIYVWEAELFALGHSTLVRGATPGRRRPAGELLAAAQQAVPAGHSVGRLTLYTAPSRAAVAIAQRLNDGAPTYFEEFQYYDEVYLDPATARVLGVVNRKYDWIFLTRMVHTNLLLADTGTRIVATATLTFVAMVLTGLVLWWPRSRSVLRTRLRVQLAGNWKRVVFDLHNVLGVYGLAGLLLIALTGPVWTWRWYQDAVAWVFTGEARLVGEPVPTPSPVVVPAANLAPSGAARGIGAGDVAERALREVVTRVPDASRYMIDIPNDPSRVLVVGAVYDRQSLWEEYERYYFHPLTAAFLGDERFEEKNLGMKWRNSNYGIHTGTLLGWPTQVLATLVSLLAASLPLTGALIWFPRWRRSRRAGA